MQLDDLKEAWAAHGNMLERSLAINERLLREVMMRRVRIALAPYALWRALEVVVGIAALLVLMPILATHIAEPRYVVVGGALAVFAAGITALSVSLLVSALRLDYDGPVTAIQRDVERIKLLEYRAFKWALLGGVVVWLPALLLLFEVATGFAALSRVHLGWLVSNLVFGLVVLAIGQALSKKHVERSDLKPWTRKLVDALSGRALQSAAGHLDEISRFQREE